MLSGAAVVASLLIITAGAARIGAQAPRTIPRMADGKPNLQGIWQVRNRAAYDLQDHAARYAMPAGSGVVEGGEIPYQPWAAKKKHENFANRATADPLAKCFMPGVPRIMYMEFPFQIFQTRDHIAMTFEWSQVYRLIYTNGTPHDDRVNSGWAIRAAAGKATRWSSTSPTTTTRRGSTWPATFTAKRCTWSSATRCSTPTRFSTR